jgi:hypothetical protein
VNDPDLLISNLGLGVNRVSLRSDDRDFPGLNRAVQGRISRGPVGGETRYSICRTASELAQAMQQQRGVSLAGLGFLPLLNAKRRFFSQLKTTVYSLSVVVQSRCVSLSAQLLEPTLLAEADLSSLDAFVSAYGDSFVNSISYGGEFIGVYTFRSETQEQMQSLELQLEAGGLLVGLGTPLNAGVGLQDALIKAESSSEVSVEMNYEVWGASKPSLRPEDLVNYAVSFTNGAIEQPALLDLTTLGYERIPQWSELFQPVASNRELFTREGGLLWQRIRMEELMNQINDTRETLQLYGVALADEAELDAAQRQVEADLQLSAGLVDAYTASASTPISVPVFASLAIGSPRIDATVAEEPASAVGRWESTIGSPFLFPFSPNTAIQQRVRLTRLALETGRQLDKLTLHYGTRAGNAVRVEKHGGDRGRPSGDVEFGPGEGVIGLESEFGSHLDRLLVSTDRGRLGGGGDAGDRQVNWQKAANEVVLGLTGRSDDGDHGAVYMLRAVVARFEGLRWQPSGSRELLDAPSPAAEAGSPG